MNMNRNVSRIVAGVLLAASLPVGAQVLGGGGGLGGAVNGTLGGQGIHGAGGIMGNGSIARPDVSGTTDKVRDGAKQAGKRTKDAATGKADAVRSKVEETRGAASVAGQGAASAQDGALLLDGATSANAEKRALGRDISAAGGAASSGRADRDGLANSTSSQTDVSVKKAEAAPAQ